MIVLGYADAGGAYSCQSNLISTAEISSVSVGNALVDTLYLSRDIDLTINDPIPIRSSWDINTLINAWFEEDLNGGNVDFVMRNMRCVRVKRREHGEGNNWITLKEIEPETFEDMKFTYIDYFARSNQLYDYAIVPVKADTGQEGEYRISQMASSFNGVWITEFGESYNVVMDLQLSTTLNQTTSTVVTMGRKYPYANRYGKSQYYTGTLTGDFVGFSDGCCKYDFEGGVRFREQVEEFLLNGKPKILKHMDGRIWMISIIDNISKDESDYYKVPKYSINFVEIGKHDSSDDLYNNGFIDVNVEEDSE